MSVDGAGGDKPLRIRRAGCAGVSLRGALPNFVIPFRRMCGICGILRLRADAPPVDRDELVRTRDAMIPRGPDGEGLWIAQDGQVGLGHRRLAIIDLSDSGLQPQSRQGGRYRITYNGEIYNYLELRRELEADGAGFETQSDTEVILALYARDGTAALSRLRGMFALAIWDDRDRTMLLARDPYGIKPLYYSNRGGTLRFASQVKALEAGARVLYDIDPVGLVGFLLWGSVPEPHTFRQDIKAVPAGHYILIENGSVGAPMPYYSMTTTGAGQSPDAAAALEDSVRAHLVSDVPVAVFLSAGMDSTLIAALACRNVGEPLTTLTLQFDDYAGTPFDEAPLAREVASALGTRHIERAVRKEDFVDLWPEVMSAMDQPSIDGFNTYVVSRVAHQEGLKVVLSGIGGDELLGSYPSFTDVPQWAQLASLMRYFPGLRPLWPRIAGKLRPQQPKLAGLLAHGASIPGAYFLRRGLFLPGEIAKLVGETLARDALAAYDPIADAGKLVDDCRRDPWETVHIMESTQYLRNQLLRDSDWASMAHSLELRTPLVDRALREAIASGGYEPGRTHGKASVVRQSAPELPGALWTRPKSGFRIPVMEWMGRAAHVDAARGPALRSMAFDVLEAFGADVAPGPRELGRLRGEAHRGRGH